MVFIIIFTKTIMRGPLKRLEVLIKRYEHYIAVSSDESSIAQARVLLRECRDRYDALKQNQQMKSRKTYQSSLDSIS